MASHNYICTSMPGKTIQFLCQGTLGLPRCILLFLWAHCFPCGRLLGIHINVIWPWLGELRPQCQNKPCTGFKTALGWNKLYPKMIQSWARVHLTAGFHFPSVQHHSIVPWDNVGKHGSTGKLLKPSNMLPAGEIWIRPAWGNFLCMSTL